MEIGEAVGRYEQAAALLPSRWQQAARRVPEHRKAQAEEFRLRAGRPMTLLTCEGELLVSDELPRQSVTQADLEQLCDAVTGYSRYAAAETMGKGYLIGRGGFRIGLCGTVAVRGDGGTALRDISSAVVRISRQVRGLWQEVPEWSVGGFDSTLIAAPPGGGKTTLLRDMIATLSNGTEDRCPLRVGVVDERGELAGMYRGVPQLDVGCHTDVLDGCPKALGIPMLLRSANPQVIAVDEITVREELEQVRHYLIIQKMRFKNKFEYTITWDEAALEETTVKLIVQPMAENAINHAIDETQDEALHIAIHAGVTEEEVIFTIEDDGVGMPPEVVDRLLTAPAGKSGIGVKNVHERIRLTYGEPYGIQVRSVEDEGTCVTIRLPRRKKGDAV